MKKLMAVLSCFMLSLGLMALQKEKSQKRIDFAENGITHVINPVAAYEGEPEEDMSDVMVPIPMKDRVFNVTGIQCVWCSINTCGRYADIEKLHHMIDDMDCKGFASPSSASKKLSQLGVRFEQTTNRKDRSLIVKSVVKERRGCLFGIPGHAMTLVHYDEKKGIVKYINNSDSTLKIRTWSMEEFNKRWDGWICVVYAEIDIIPLKYSVNQMKINSPIPIIDRNREQGAYTKDYVLTPIK